MIRGQVTANREAVVELAVRATDGRLVHVQSVLDTGFTEFLALPSPVVREMGWPKLYTDRMMPADGSTIALDVYDGVVVWEGVDRAVEVHADGEGLVGMSLLYGSRVSLDVVDGGTVVVEPMAP